MRMPSRAAAILELFKRGLAAEGGCLRGEVGRIRSDPEDASWSRREEVIAFTLQDPRNRSAGH